MRYAVITQHPNRRERCLLVHSWHPTEDEADAATLRLVMEFSETVDGQNIILPSLAGSALFSWHRQCIAE